MTKVKDIYDFLDSIAPFKSAMDFDNCGILVGDPDCEVKSAVISLDITSEVCDEVHDLGANLIISHHPIIFKPIKNISFKNVVSKMIKNEINAICAHTNLDISDFGVNFHLASSLSISNLSPLCMEKESPLGFVGELKEEMNSKEFAIFVKEKLNCKGVRYTNIKSKIKKVGVCSGSGGSLVKEAYKKGVDAFVTGEIKHSEILLANSLGITVVDAGHFKTENVIINPLNIMLSEKFKNVKFTTSKSFSDKIDYI